MSEQRYALATQCIGGGQVSEVVEHRRERGPAVGPLALHLRAGRLDGPVDVPPGFRHPGEGDEAGRLGTGRAGPGEIRLGLRVPAEPQIGLAE